MSFLAIIPYYIAWHYSNGLKDYFTVWTNLVWFIWNLFSVKALLRTFFQPFKRLKEKYHGGLDVEDFMSALVVTTIMRFIGMLLRTVMIIIGVAFTLLFIVGGLVGILVWLVLPWALLFTIGASLIKMLP